MKKNFLYFLLLTFALLLISNNSFADSKRPVFSKSDISKIADKFVHNNVNIEDPAIVDVDGDGVFDILAFKHGDVAYYRNNGTNDAPDFVLITEHYDKYKAPAIINGMPMPVFFADEDGDGDLDMFAIKDKGYNKETKQNEYRVLLASNAFDLDTGTLITIILVLVVIVLVIAILGH
jgi:hypothetical protein